MSYQVFARKYRPRTFDDVLGQDHVVRTLRNAINQQRLAHAYLFVGPRGTGKTSTARIFAKALNCPGGPKADFDPDDELCVEIEKGICLDVREIDGASNNGVEQVRELREEVKFAPSRCRFKIYYIDEVHMLSTAAFNALLKTLEEPPEHVKFIFATTEAHKVLPTIISRCQRFDLRRIPISLIAKHLLHIAKLEGINLDEKAAYAIGKGAEGGMRDAQSMLDQLVAFCGERIQEADVMDIFGFTRGETVANLAMAVLRQDTVGALQELHAQMDAGKDLTRLLADLIQHFRTLLVHQVDAAAVEEDLSPEMVAMMREQAAMVQPEPVLRIMDGLAEVDARMRWAGNKLLHLEIGIIQAVQTLGEVTLSDVIRAIGAPEGEAPVLRTPLPPQQPVARRAAPPSPEPVLVAPAPAPVVVRVAEPEPTPPPPAPVQTQPPPVEPKVEPPVVVHTPVAPPQAERIAEAREPERETIAEPEADLLGVSLDLDPQDAWKAFVDRVHAEKPIMAHWVELGTLLGRADGVLTMGLPITETAARDNLLRPQAKKILEALLPEYFGKPHRLEIVLDPSLQPPPATEMSFDLGEAPPAKAPSAGEGKAAAPSKNDAPVEEEPKIVDSEFYNDPLVQAALVKFKATLAD